MTWVFLIPALPAAAFAVLLPLSRRMRNRMVWFSVGSIAVSLVLSIVAFFRVWPGGWNKEQSIRKFIEVAEREAGPRMLGYMATTWTSLNDVVAGLAGEPIDPEKKRVPDIVAGVRLGAELAGASKA